VGLARKAEALGFAGLTLSDHMFSLGRHSSGYPYSADGSINLPPESHWPDLWVAIGAMAAVTTRLRFSTNVYILPLRNPLVTAKAVATAALISDNRLTCGVRVGSMKEDVAAAGAG